MVKKKHSIRLYIKIYVELLAAVNVSFLVMCKKYCQLYIAVGGFHFHYTFYWCLFVHSDRYRVKFSTVAAVIRLNRLMNRQRDKSLCFHFDDLKLFAVTFKCVKDSWIWQFCFRQCSGLRWYELCLTSRWSSSRFVYMI